MKQRLALTLIWLISFVACGVSAELYILHQILGNEERQALWTPIMIVYGQVMGVVAIWWFGTTKLRTRQNTRRRVLSVHSYRWLVAVFLAVVFNLFVLYWFWVDHFLMHQRPLESISFAPWFLSSFPWLAAVPTAYIFFTPGQSRSAERKAE